MSPRRTVHLVAVLALATACTTGADEPGDGPDDPSPDPSAATADPTPDDSPTPTTSPTASPSPTTPATPPVPADADGCPPAPDERAVLPAPADEPVTTSTEQVTESPAGRTIDVTVLEVAGAAGPTITRDLRARVDELVARWDEAAGTAPEGAPAPELELEVTAARADETLTSVVLTGFEYLGGASGNEISGAVTYATATGTPLTLADVGLDGDCRDELGAALADDLVARGTGLFDEAEQALRAGEVAMDAWSVHDDGTFRVHFPPYEVAPGVAGAVTAVIDLDDVRTLTGTPLPAA